MLHIMERGLLWILKVKIVNDGILLKPVSLMTSCNYGMASG